MENDSVSQSLKLYIVLSRAYKAINEHVNKVIQASGLNPTEFAVLELLYHKGDQPMQQIGGKILLASGSITYVVDKLEQKGFLVRIACPNDRRVTFAQITDKGKEFIQEIFPEHAEQIHSLMSSLTDPEKQEAIELLKKLGLPAGKF
ncbi:MarR family 2-MHQ and catechol resistance regulon transcriptional repressor [Bacillus niacini]|jgi:MarR family transcriptional regulator, 2-MHQ and catechol-resistance regulon repressor|uniref:MarR family 2-MHQ and catechol resistance regulon transcriptional repressor n=2 Tax=Neobacillus TaxID=2675232 RepID=A0A852TDC8_9BACI|nr:MULTISPECIES: MarR family transcriptional regulator [Neobacillus]MDP5192304.1 MarR family transcriptional regulator [Neobacillus sp. 179.-C4.2 HS]MDQ0972894.1 MarR family 2-MHQ and catechol resistance regulon transcriptional repressor [Neobacillus niacini]NYE05398.1 MarR family 2-MHQ and catechol resistance regulon transcriptional repressor [Neobacillus niacini]